MGLFDIFNKKNKDILTDNGINYIHEKDGKGKLKESFTKKNGVLHGEYIKYSNGKICEVDEYIDGKKVLKGKEKERYDASIAILKLHYKFFKELIEVDSLFSKLSSIDLILKMQKKTLSEYACLLNNKFSGKFNPELIEVYLFFKRNQSIDSILCRELEPHTYYDNAFTEFLISNKKHVEYWLNSDKIYSRPRHHINYSFSYGLTLSHEIRSYVGITFQYNCDLTDKKLIPENFIRKLLWDDSPLYGLNPDLLSELRSIINECYDYPYKLDVTDKKLYLEIWERIDSIIFSEKENQEGELLNIISTYIKEKDKKEEFSFIQDLDFAGQTKTPLKFTNDLIRVAVNEWMENSELAAQKYGHISEWDTSEVTDMSTLFQFINNKADNFNENINDWDVSNVISMELMFDSAISFNQPLDKWDVSNVKYMNGMFMCATSFNQSLEMWDVSNVEFMTEMFYEASSFNQPLNKWDISKVIDMDSMFYKASNYIQYLDWYDFKSNNSIISESNSNSNSNIDLSMHKKSNSKELKINNEYVYSFLFEDVCYNYGIDEGNVILAWSICGISINKLTTSEDFDLEDYEGEFMNEFWNKYEYNSLLFSFKGVNNTPVRIIDLPSGGEINSNGQYHTNYGEFYSTDEIFNFIDNLNLNSFKEIIRSCDTKDEVDIRYLD